MQNINKSAVSHRTIYQNTTIETKLSLNRQDYLV